MAELGDENRTLDLHFEKGPSGYVELVASCGKAFDCEVPLLFLGEFGYAELASAAGVDPGSGFSLPAGFFANPKKRLFLASGWQSWSFAGELTWKERPRRAVIQRSLNLFVDHPAEAELRALARRKGLRPDIVSHFFAVLREKDARLGLVSTAWGKAGRRAGPPLSFLFGPKSLRIYAYAEGGSFALGETLARVALVPAADYFRLKDGFAKIVAGDAGRFASLSGLCDLSSPRPRLGGFETWYNRYLNIDEKAVLDDLEAFAAAPGVFGAPGIIGSPDIAGAPGQVAAPAGKSDGAVPAADNAAPATEGGAILGRALGPGLQAVFQIDDGWERRVGDWRPDPVKFPEGMGKLAGAIRAKGFAPGIWLAPFLVMPGSPLELEHPGWILCDGAGAPVLAGWNPGWGGDVHCLDLSIPEVEEYLVDLLGAVVRDWGFAFLKLDFLYAGMIRGKRRGRAGGAWEHYARVLSRIAAITTAPEASSAAGRSVAILACGAPFETTIPIAPLMRVGADTKEVWDWTLLKLIGHQGRPSAKVNISHSLARSLLDRTFLLSDPDVVFSRTENIKLKDPQKFLAGLVAWAFASQIMTSDAPGGASDSGSSGGPRVVARAGSLSQTDFLTELSSLCRKLGDREFAVERFDLSSQDLYDFRSRDGAIYGAINLSSKTEVLALEAQSNAPSGIASGASSGGAKTAVLPPRSIVLFGLEANED